MTAPSTSTCDEVGTGLVDARLVCIRPHGHDGEHYDPWTEARWSLTATTPDEPASPLPDAKGQGNAT